MDILELMKHRRSIRKYQEKQITRETLEAILEAGLYAPNAGGGQRSKIVGIRNAELAETIGKLNIARFDRSRLAGNYVSKDQPSIIDDPSLQHELNAISILQRKRKHLFTILQYAQRRCPSAILPTLEEWYLLLPHMPFYMVSSIGVLACLVCIFLLSIMERFVA